MISVVDIFGSLISGYNSLSILLAVVIGVIAGLIVLFLNKDDSTNKKILKSTSVALVGAIVVVLLLGLVGVNFIINTFR